jgi:NADPH:quinone reductase
MRVVQATRFGDPDVLAATEAPDPVAAPGQLVVDVAVADVLFLDTQLRAGWGGDYFALEPPYVPGAGVAGIVSFIGEGVDPAWLDRTVVAGTGRTGEYAGGGYAERAAVPVDVAFVVPDGLEPRDAIAALHDGMTALSRLEKADIEPKDRVLVTAAGGSLGAWLVPLARAAGATVIAAARGQRKLELARQRGADLTVDYSEPGWTEWVREADGGGGVDVVFDGAGGQIGRAAFDMTAQGGRFFSYGSASGTFPDIDPREAEQRDVTVIGIDERITADDRRRITERALAEVAAGRITPVIGQALPLERAAEAHAAIESRSVAGKTLLEVTNAGFNGGTS